MSLLEVVRRQPSVRRPARGVVSMTCCVSSRSVSHMRSLKITTYGTDVALCRVNDNRISAHRSSNGCSRPASPGNGFRIYNSVSVLSHILNSLKFLWNFFSGNLSCLPILAVWEMLLSRPPVIAAPTDDVWRITKADRRTTPATYRSCQLRIHCMWIQYIHCTCQSLSRSFV